MIHGFKIGDKVRLKDGDGRTHIIKEFVKVSGVHGPDFYRVIFEDDSATDHIFADGLTQMEKIEQSRLPVPPDKWETPLG